MTNRREPLERIAAALERLAPPIAEPTDWLLHPAYVWNGKTARPIAEFEAMQLGKLRGIDQQKDAVLCNFERLAGGAATHDILLWGARGMGKSALIRAAIADVQARHAEKLALVQIAPGGLDDLAALVEALEGHNRGFVLFLDDLGFGADDARGNLALRSLLDGGVLARPSNIRLAVTSNRRAIVQRNQDEGLALHERDERDDALALADRFGLSLGFHPCDQATYLEIVRSYADPLGLRIDEEEASAWATSRGNRSGRTAYQFACELAGRAGKQV